ncbi:MAG: phenylalanine--tRNA ligase subunit alpha [Candidatus Saccharimonadales bacterium]
MGSNMIDQTIAEGLRARAQDGDQTVLRSTELRSLFDQLKTLPPEERGSFGKAVNELRQELQATLESCQETQEQMPAIDVTAPWYVNTAPTDRPTVGHAPDGSLHPLTQEITCILDIFARMGFAAIESRQIDDDYHMFGSLNFPEGHPARDDYDTFMTEDGLVAPAHTSTMQNRIMSANKHLLERGEAIAYVIPGRVFRNEDLDATHEHTFHQLEGVYVSKDVHAGVLIAVLQTYLNEYFGEELQTKLQPFYFPFTEPSFEMAVERPTMLRKDNSEEQKWLELLGCGMIHPNVLRMAGIDPEVYTGFAWGQGIERMVMMKNEIEDVRHFNSAKLDFLRQF